MRTQPSIRRQLQRLILYATASVLAFACVVFVFFEYRNSLNAQTQSTLSTARITADASSGTLAFTNPGEAKALLRAFRLEPGVLAAALYDSDGKLFAEYRTRDAFGGVPRRPRRDGLYAGHARLATFQPVLQNGKRFGTLYLQTDLRPMYARLAAYGWTALCIFGFALLASYFVAQLLQRSISDPILSLAGAAQAISRRRDYSVRAEPAEGAELQLLTTAFNQMLEEIQRQQQSLAKEKELLATTLSSIGDAVIATDQNGSITFLNAEAERLTGWKSSEAAGQPLMRVFHILNEMSRQSVENPVEKVLRLGAVVGLANHTVLIARDGAETPIDDSAAPIRQSGGPLFGVVLVFRDVTEQRRAEQTRARLAAIVEFSGDVIIAKDLNGIIRSWNAAAEGLFGYAAGEIVGKSIRLLFPPERLDEEDDIEAQLRQGQAVTRLETVRVAKDGKRIPVRASASPIKDAEGNIIGVSSVIQDITERKRANDALRDAHAQLADRAYHLERLVTERTAKLQEMVNELQHVSYAIVHDMRAPLRAMNTFASVILEEISAAPHLPPQVLDYCNRIITAAGRLDRLILDSLSYTKSVLQQVPLRPVDLGRLIPNLIDTYPNLQPDKADITIEDPLPVVVGDESLLTQCFSNLLGNAVKFVAPGVRPQIRLRATLSDNTARITVEDNGIGIPPRAQPRLFGMFQRLTAEYEGTGIGLAIVRKVTERMGGRVGVDSQPGKGSRFWVELKVAGDAAPEA